MDTKKDLKALLNDIRGEACKMYTDFCNTHKNLQKGEKSEGYKNIFKTLFVLYGDHFKGTHIIDEDRLMGVITKKMKAIKKAKKKKEYLEFIDAIKEHISNELENNYHSKTKAEYDYQYPSSSY